MKNTTNTIRSTPLSLNFKENLTSDLRRRTNIKQCKMAQTAKKPQKDDKHTCILFWLLYNCHQKNYLAPKIAEKNNPAPISAEKKHLALVYLQSPPRISNGPPLSWYYDSN